MTLTHTSEWFERVLQEKGSCPPVADVSAAICYEEIADLLVSSEHGAKPSAHTRSHAAPVPDLGGRLRSASTGGDSDASTYHHAYVYAPGGSASLSAATSAQRDQELKHSPQQLDEFVKVMDRHNIALCVSLDGKLGDAFDEHARFLWTKYPNRFLIFANVDWIGEGRRDDPASWDCQREDFAHRTALALSEAKQKGASGLKIKNIIDICGTPLF